MSRATLRTRISRLAKALANAGFRLDAPFRLKRNKTRLDQFIEFQPGSKWLCDQFTCNLCWEFALDGSSDDGSYDYSIRIGFLVGNSDLWFAHEPGPELDASIDRLRVLLEQRGLPFLDSVGELSEMVRAYEQDSGESGDIIAPASPTFFFWNR